MSNRWLDWCIFLLLCVIWGSSFILMKLGLFSSTGQPLLSAYQVAAIRIAGAGICLLPFLKSALRPWPSGAVLGQIVGSGLLGSFFPAFLYCLAETQINSAMAGMLNATTPLFTLLIGAGVFGMPIARAKWLGIGIGLLGCLLLFVDEAAWQSGQLPYAGMVLLATVCYGFNVNMVRRYLHQVGSVQIATLALVALLPLSICILVASGYFALPLASPAYIKASLSAFVLGAAGTALASILFYVLVKRAGVVFSSMVTYGIPFVALAWGLLYGEAIGTRHIGAMGVILVGVYVANRQVSKN